jgi:hypothetical protein
MFFPGQSSVTAREANDHLLPVDKFPAQLFGAILIRRNLFHDLFDRWLLGRR